MTNKIVILDNSVELYEHYIDDAKWERTLAFPRGGVTYLVSNGTIKFYAYEDYLYRNCLISMQLPIRVVDEFEHIDGEYEDIDELVEVLDRVFPTNDIDAELDEYLRIKDADLLYQPKGDYILRSEVPDLNSFVTDEELVEALEDYYTKDETSGKTEIQDALDGKADKSDTYTKAEVDNIANGKADANDVYTKRECDSKFQLKGNYVSANTFISYTATTNAALANKANRDELPDITPYFDDAEYDSESRKIKFFHNGVLKAQIDATPFIKDGMVNNVKFEDGYLIITFNTDAGKEPIAIELGSILDPSNYYTKAEVGDRFQPIGNYVSASTYTAFTSTTNTSINNLRTTKLDASAYTPCDLSNYYTKDDVYSKSETYNKNEIDDKISQSGTFDPTRYYTKANCDSRFALKNEIPSLNGYATEDWVLNKNYATRADFITYINNMQTQINSLIEAVSGCCETQEDVYRWLTIIGEYLCEDNNKYEKQKYQVSHDGGIVWEDVTPIQYQKGQLLETDSEDCGYVPDPQYRWKAAPTSDYMCSGTSKYYKVYYEVSYDGGQTWQHAVPEQTKRGNLIERNSTDCGYIAPQYRWKDAATSDYMCSGTTKYKKQYYQVSNDGGTTWQNVSPEQTRRGSVIEYNSADCGYIAPQYRWYTAPNTDYLCSGTTKYQKQYYQVSYNGGSTWQNVSPTQTRRGDIIETNSTDCGYIAPQYRWQKAVSTDYACVNYDKHYKEYYQVSYDGGTTWANVEPTSSRTSSDIIESNSPDCGYPQAVGMVIVNQQLPWINITGADNTIRRSDLEAKLTSTQIANITELNLFTNCKHIANGAFQGLTKLYFITNMGVNLETIGDNAFNGCTLLEQIQWHDYIKTIGANAFKNTKVENVVLPETLTSIGNGAFSGCSSMLQVVLLGKTPPTLSSNSHAFDGSTCKIYVPASAVNTYKTATGWSKYASRIATKGND